MFVVDAKHIVVLNNEVGFNEKNIRALCNVGKSTKGPHQYGYIGTGINRWVQIQEC